MTFDLRAAGSGDCDAIAVVEVRGEVDAANAAELEAALAGLACPALVVDLSGAGYFDSAGFAVLDRLLARTPLAVGQARAALPPT
jgi:anti-anti-sigma factor